MPRFAANLSTLYPQLPFLERFEAAASDGFEAVECQFPYEFDVVELRARLDALGLQQVLINAPAGDAAHGERGLACLPGREEDFRKGLERALTYAAGLRCPRVHVMAGIVPAPLDRASVQPVYVANLAWAAQRAREQGVDLTIEPINQRDMPGYFLNRQDHAHELLEAIGAPNLKVQMDLYHCQVVEGDVSMKLRRLLQSARVGHLQIAGAPDRHEPDEGELNYAHIFRLIDELGYAGWVGCEYHPRGDTSAGLRRWKAALLGA